MTILVQMISSGSLSPILHVSDHSASVSLDTTKQLSSESEIESHPSVHIFDHIGEIEASG